jgi:AraC-like DNA-binding protein
MSLESEKVGQLRFSTDDVPTCDRVAVWREVVGRVYTRLDVEPIGEQPLRATVEQHSWPELSIFFGDATPANSSRTKDLISDGGGDFRLLRANGARYQYVSQGATEEIDYPDAGLIFNGVVGTSQFLESCRFTTICIPRERLASAVRGLEDRPIRRLSWSSPHLRLLASYIELIRAEGPASDPVLSRRVSDHLIDLLALALEPTKDALVKASSAVRNARLAAIRADILTNLSQVRLSAKTLARRHGLTDRYIHLLFEETGETFGQFVLEERLKRAFHLLADPSCGKRITDIASDVGFGDLSTFNRAFRRRFGDTPSGTRRNQWGN